MSRRGGVTGGGGGGGEEEDAKTIIWRQCHVEAMNIEKKKLQCRTKSKSQKLIKYFAYFLPPYFSRDFPSRFDNNDRLTCRF